jgi:hypothetical protein
MPRLARLNASGVLHHIIIRGIERKKIFKDEAPRSKLRGIKAELRRSLTRLRSDELPPSLKLRRDMSARFTSPSSVGSKPLAKTDHPCSPPKNCGGQGIQAKANKSDQKNSVGRLARLVPATQTFCYAWVLMTNMPTFCFAPAPGGSPR